MTFSSASAFAGFRFPPEVISVAMRWHLRYGLSYRGSVALGDRVACLNDRPAGS